MTHEERKAFEKGFLTAYASDIYVSVLEDSTAILSDIWFDTGKLGNTPLGNIEFYNQTEGIYGGYGTNNKDTYLDDGYILLSYEGTARRYLSYIISELLVPRNVYKNVIVDYTLDSYPIELYHPHIGLMSYKEHQTETYRFSYRTELTLTQDVKQHKLDLTAYNSGNTSMYLHIGGGSKNLKIYKIQLELLDNL